MQAVAETRMGRPHPEGELQANTLTDPVERACSPAVARLSIVSTTSTLSVREVPSIAVTLSSLRVRSARLLSFVHLHVAQG